MLKYQQKSFTESQIAFKIVIFDNSLQFHHVCANANCPPHASEIIVKNWIFNKKGLIKIIGSIDTDRPTKKCDVTSEEGGVYKKGFTFEREGTTNF